MKKLQFYLLTFVSILTFSFACNGQTRKNNEPQDTSSENIDKKSLIGVWASDPEGPNADFEFTENTIYYTDVDQPNEFKYDIQGNKLLIHKADHDELSYIIANTRDSLIILDENGHQTVYSRWENKESSSESIVGTIKTFEFWDDTLSQILTVKWLSETSIEFTLTTNNRKKKCTKSISGKATNKYPGGDMETDEDESGDAYDVIEYTYESKECSAFLRISSDLDKVTVNIADCAEKQGVDCPLKSLSVLQVNN